MTSIEVILPKYPLTTPDDSYNKVALDVIAGSNVPSTEEDIYPVLHKFGFAVFRIDGGKYKVLFQHLAEAWSYPSSYQLIAKFVKKAGLSKDSFVESTSPELNALLLKTGSISKHEAKSSLFYTDLATIYSSVSNKQVFFSDETVETTAHSVQEDENLDEMEVDEEDNDDANDDNEDEDAENEEDNDDEEEDEKIVVKKRTDYKAANPNEKITISQAFPQYGLIDSSIQLNHSAFNALNSLTKLNYYKNIPGSSYKFLQNSKLNFFERELIIRDHDYSKIQVNDHKNDEQQQQEKKRFRKPIGKSKKHNINVDPNAIDLSESVIPGQGYIQEFNVNHLCKVPNYYITSNQQSVSSSSSTSSLFNLKKINSASNSSFLFNDNIKMSKNIQQLVFSNDSDNYNHSKYYYTKSYRGPGSGNYKDAALMNRINKIHLTTDPLKVTHTKHVSKLIPKRYNQGLKGLVYDKYSKSWVDSVLAKQRKYTEDYMNLEILHNNLQFNLLLNTYRDISEETWQYYYKFKNTDFEQLRALQRENDEIKLRREAIEKRQEWEIKERERQEKLRKIIEEERFGKMELQRERIQRQKDVEEKRRQKQLEASFNDPFGNDSSSDNNEASTSDLDVREQELTEKCEQERQELLQPIPPPNPIETPQLDIVNRFTLPSVYPEIVKKLPTELRDAQPDNNDVPNIKKPIRYLTTYPDKSNPELLNRIEIIKLPNSNSVGWDNLKKFRED
ncbi:uncharacterized protein RJT20DRAFT_131296 [Scheffersomyces xylosifermentans]|uniref:uncharacterized protein n=1 Tax=Scheffersomyces xylosifermentans TaxID=1304137 RepID=UPI00315D8134